jgi:hypothetical protein
MEIDGFVQMREREAADVGAARLQQGIDEDLVPDDRVE